MELGPQEEHDWLGDGEDGALTVYSRWSIVHSKDHGRQSTDHRIPFLPWTVVRRLWTCAMYHRLWTLSSRRPRLTNLCKRNASAVGPRHLVVL